MKFVIFIVMFAMFVVRCRSSKGTFTLLFSDNFFNCREIWCHISGVNNYFILFSGVNLYFLHPFFEIKVD